MLNMYISCYQVDIKLPSSIYLPLFSYCLFSFFFIEKGNEDVNVILQ